MRVQLRLRREGRSSGCFWRPAGFRPQVPDRGARIGQAGAHQGAGLVELVQCRLGRSRLARAGKQPGEQFQLHRDPHKALGQGVVNLPRDPPPLAQHRTPSRLYFQHPPAIHQVSQQSQGAQGERGIKPPRLVIVRHHAQAEGSARRYSRPRHCWRPAPGSDTCAEAGWCKRQLAGCPLRSSPCRSLGADSDT